MIAEEDHVVTRMMYRGTQRGEIFSVAPTGKKIAYAGAAFFRIANGKVAEGWVLGDLLSVLRQIGASKIP
jgi:predicted ester cyclase